MSGKDSNWKTFLFILRTEKSSASDEKLSLFFLRRRPATKKWREKEAKNLADKYYTLSPLTINHQRLNLACVVDSSLLCLGFAFVLKLKFSHHLKNKKAKARRHGEKSRRCFPQNVREKQISNWKNFQISSLLVLRILRSQHKSQHLNRIIKIDL